MRMHGRRAGTTLIDLIITLSLVAIALGIATPGVVRARDEYSVRSARDAVAGAVEDVRTLAVARGTARLVIEPQAGRIRIEAPAGIPSGSVTPVTATFGVAVSVDGATAATVAFDYNGIGLGVMASRTVRFRRGGAEAGLSFSTYGRVRRW